LIHDLLAESPALVFHEVFQRLKFLCSQGNGGSLTMLVLQEQCVRRNQEDADLKLLGWSSGDRRCSARSRYRSSAIPKGFTK